MTKVLARPSVTDSYFRYVKRFPLTRLRDDAHLDDALGVIDELIRCDLDSGGEEYLDVLTDLVERYEDAEIPFGNATESEILRELIRANGSSQSKLAAETGIAQSTLSAVLSGSRTLTKPQVAALARRFRVSPAAFFPTHDSRDRDGP